MDLTATERAVLVDLIAIMIAADGETSPDEISELLELDDELGASGLFEQIAAAPEKSRAEVMSGAATVERKAARDFIRTVLHDVAASDGVVDSEQAILDQLAAVWS